MPKKESKKFPGQGSSFAKGKAPRSHFHQVHFSNPSSQKHPSELLKLNSFRKSNTGCYNEWQCYFHQACLKGKKNNNKKPHSFKSQSQLDSISLSYLNSQKPNEKYFLYFQALRSTMLITPKVLTLEDPCDPNLTRTSGLVHWI